MKRLWKKNIEKTLKLGVTLIATFFGFWFIAIDLMTRFGMDFNKWSSLIAICVAIFCELGYVNWISKD